MIQFLKDAAREFKHVVWPTRKETQKFFSLVLALLAFFGVYLFIASNIFSEVIFGLKSVLGPDTGTNSSSSMSQEDVDAIFSQEVQIDVANDTQSGSVEEEATGTGEISE
jgi:preprotein translocase SecE subunit